MKQADSNVVQPSIFHLPDTQSDKKVKNTTLSNLLPHSSHHQTQISN